jgi:hypothetical protein
MYTVYRSLHINIRENQYLRKVYEQEQQKYVIRIKFKKETCHAICSQYSTKYNGPF